MIVKVVADHPSARERRADDGRNPESEPSPILAVIRVAVRIGHARRRDVIEEPTGFVVGQDVRRTTLAVVPLRSLRQSEERGCGQEAQPDQRQDRNDAIEIDADHSPAHRHHGCRDAEEAGRHGPALAQAPAALDEGAGDDVAAVDLGQRGSRNLGAGKDPFGSRQHSGGQNAFRLLDQPQAPPGGACLSPRRPASPCPRARSCESRRRPC